MKNNALVCDVLGSTTKRASDMTQALCKFGSGDMGKGIVRLWETGQDAGRIKSVPIAVVTFALGVGACLVGQYVYQKKKKEVEPCLEAAKNYSEIT